MRRIRFSPHAAGHAAPITNVSFSPLRPWLASASYDGSVIVWALEDRAVRAVHRVEHCRLVNGSAWSPVDADLLATASADKTIGVWRVTDGAATQVASLSRHTDDVNGVAWSPDGSRLLGASLDGRVSIWSGARLTFEGWGPCHDDHCMAAAADPDGLVVSVGEDCRVIVQRDDGRARRRDFPFSVEGCAWRPGHQQAALACDDGAVRLVDADLEILDVWPCAQSAVRSVSWFPDGRRLAVGTYDATVKVLHDGAVVAATGEGRVWPRSVAYGYGVVAAGSFGSSPTIYDAETLELLVDGGAPTHGPNALAAAGGFLSVGTDSGLVIDLDLDDLAAGPSPFASDRISVRSVSSAPVLSLGALSPEDLLVGTYDATIRRCRSGGVETVSVSAPVPSISALGPDAAMAGTYGGELLDLDLAGPLRVAGRRAVHHGSVKSVTPAPDGGVLSAGTDARVRYESPDGTTVDLWSHANLINDVAVDGRFVASASRDRLVHAAHLVGPATIDRHWHLQGADESMKAVAVAERDGRALVVGGSYDFCVYSWAISPGDDATPSAVVVAEFDQAVSALTFIGDLLVTASWDGTLAFHRVTPALELEPVTTVRMDDLVAVGEGAVSGVAP